MRKSIAVLVASIIWLTSAFAGSFSIIQLGNPSGGGGSQAWYILPIGAGGDLIRMDLAYDGTNTSITTTTDTYGAYLWNPSATAPNGQTGAWQQLINSNSMPATFVNNAVALASDGVYALASAPSAAQTMYMVFNAYQANQFPALQTVYKSTNQGTTWTITNFNGSSSNPIDVKQDFNSGTNDGTSVPIKSWGPKMAIDPTTANTVLVGTGANGMYYTTDGGNTWNAASGIPTATTGCGGSCSPGYSGVVISKFNHNHVFAFSYGNGMYETTTGITGTWTKINSGSGPTGVLNAQEDPSNGNYYCIDRSLNAWQWNGTTWTQVYSGADAHAIAIDPSTANHVIIGNGNGLLFESTNGTSFGSASSQQTSNTNDVLWLGSFTANIQDLFFDPTVTNKIYTVSDRAFFKTTFTSPVAGTTVTWALQSRGIEQLVANRVIVPATNTPITTQWDTAAFKPSFTSYPSGPVYPTTATTLFGGWSIDYCSSNAADIVLIADGAGDGSGQFSSYSTNTGASFTAFSAIPSNAYNGSTGAANGSISCSTPTNVVWCPSGAVACSYTSGTSFGSPTWNTSTSPPGTTSWSGFTGGGQNGSIAIAADRVTANTFYLYYSGVGFFQSTNSGASWGASAIYSYTLPTGAFQVKAAPGQSGDFWFSGGNNQPGNREPCGTDLLHYSGGSMTRITNVECPLTVGFGVNSGGSGVYPSVFIVGWVNVAGTFTYGVWRSDNAGSGGATPTWNQIGPYPNSQMDLAADISGDPSVYGQAYLGFRGSAWAVYR